MSVDASKLKKGVKIRLETGEVLIVRGCYMSTTGIMVTAGDDWLLDHGVNYWAGPRSLPLWLPAPYAPFAQRSSERFHTSGGAARSPAETLRDVLDDERVRGLARPRRSGLTREEEVELLAALHPHE